ncbi:MAG: hypothetical protein K2N42_01095 [Anaeroplasmataceae bacterium]|nr:hypothetical protein [Anaeroplasmataceae bacterium]
MDFFDEQEAKEKEKLVEEKYQELYQKQSRISRIVLLATFIPMGLLFVLLGIIFLVEGTEKEGALVCLIMGLSFCIFGVVFYFVLPKKGNYQRYKEIVKKRGGLNLFDLSITVGILEERINQLEAENKSLIKRIEELERNNR